MPELAHVIRCRWEQQVGAQPSVHRILPDNCSDILVTADGRAVLVGPPTGVELPTLPAGTIIRGLRFHPHALGIALGLDAAELTDRTVPLDAVLRPAQARAVAEAVWDIDAAELPGRWRDVRPDRTTVGIVRALTTPGQPGVDVIAQKAGYSARHLRRLVRAETGLAPKTLHRVARLHDFLRQTEKSGLPVGVAAVTAGYADQPHASREIRALTGLSPVQLLTERAAR